MLSIFLIPICVVLVSCKETSDEDRAQSWEDGFQMKSNEEDISENLENSHEEVIITIEHATDSNRIDESPKILETMHCHNDTQRRNAEESNTIKTSDGNNQGSRNEQEFPSEDTNSLINYPYTASIKRKGSHYATGALIDKRWVISSAAEFYTVQESIRLFVVVLGSVDNKRGGSVFPLLALEIHPRYAPGTPAHDLALLRLAFPATQLPVIKPIPIAVSNDSHVIANAKYRTTYWPRIFVHNNVLDPAAAERVKTTSLRVSTQRTMPPEECAAALDGVCVTRETLCLVPIQMYHSKCLKDAGAPLVAHGLLWGVTSGWTPPGCASLPDVHSVPTLFTRVDSAGVRLWIHKHLLP